MELWAGVECTMQRVGDRYGDQMAYSGHAVRITDLDLFAGLGVRALRYPVLWERTAPEQPGNSKDIDWTWADARLNRLRELGVRPIVGLTHHGSGPRHTSLVDPCYAEKLAAYALQVAERFDWVEGWTPINEPLTTARFSGLYGHWYPHGRDEQTFARALINQCRGTILAMRAIRQVNPAARLIQTDDLGKIYSTPHLAYQADFENERRWLSWDLLCGRVNGDHRMWGHLQWAGISEDELRWFLDNPCPPDVIGINHYLTSERFIDERLDRYPPPCYGENAYERYADVEAVRVLAEGTGGIRGMIQETWERYGLPVAITEAHLGCTREEQMRWLLEAWTSAQDAHKDGVDIRAVTAWALLGSYDWNSLLTRFEGAYEPGIYDMRGGVPRPTALAGLMKAMGSGHEPAHPVLASPGWWRRPKRLLYPPIATNQRFMYPTNDSLRVRREPARRILVMGAGGALGYAFARLCDHRELAHHDFPHHELDITDAAAVERAMEQIKPWAVINAAGCGDIDAAERDPPWCERVHGGGVSVLAAACARHNAALLTFSSDQVFDGAQSGPYHEGHDTAPLNAYGRSHARSEAEAQRLLPSVLVVRSGPLFGPWDANNFLTSALREIAALRTVRVPHDQTVSPTYIPDLVHACLDLLIDGESGVWHLANAGVTTWKAFVQQAADRAGLEPRAAQGVPLRKMPFAAPRPHFSAITSRRGVLLPSLETALACYLQDGSRQHWNVGAETQHHHRPETPAARTSGRRAALAARRERGHECPF